MCLSSPKTPAPVKVAAPPPVTAASPQFDTELADVQTTAQGKDKTRLGKDKLKVASKADPSLAVGGGTGGSGTGNGINVTT